jgi:hypothetical protein
MWITARCCCLEDAALRTWFWCINQSISIWEEKSYSSEEILYDKIDTSFQNVQHLKKITRTSETPVKLLIISFDFIENLKLFQLKIMVQIEVLDYKTPL